MRYEIAFEAEPFQGFAEFDETEWLETETGRGWQSEVNRRAPAFVRRVQDALNRALGLRLKVDGKEGPQTRSAIRSFQMRRGLKVTGVVDAKTEQTLFSTPGGKKKTSPAKVGEPTCGAAAHDLERLKAYLEFVNNELQKTPPDAHRLDLKKQLVTSQVQVIIDSLGGYIEAGCCEPALKGLEAEVRGLPWPADADMARERDRLIDAIRRAQDAAKKDFVHC